MFAKLKQLLHHQPTPPPAPSRVAKLLAGINPETMSGLEIGPLDRPIVDRRRGYRVKYVDHNSTDELRARFKNDGNVNTAGLAEVDFVVNGGNMLEVVNETFDYIVASHVFEHVPNPILWLEEMAALLNCGGLLCMAVPDRRYTFDLIRPQTSVGEMLEAYFTKRSRPTFKNVFDQNYYWRQVDAAQAWAGTANPWEMQPPLDKQVALSYASRAINTEEYLDVHCNVLTSHEFLVFLEALKTYKLARLELVNIHHCEPNDFEFIVQMQKPATPMRKTQT
jgi:SAM-dependent methyltransferase